MLRRKYNDTAGHFEWEATCDECKNLFTHRDRNTVVRSRQPDNLTELMRRKGWITKRPITIGDPMKWICLDCQKKEKKSA